jgi:Uma2 family endonuclease
MARSVTPPATYDSPGPFLASGLRPGDRYELSNGHAIYCAPTGGDGSRANLVGARVLSTDPEVTEAGIDAGYSFGPRHLRAPDISIGNVPDRPGWIAGAPPLAVEYAGSGQDEDKLQEKIADLLGAGTRWIWVVRLLGPRRVEIYEADRPIRTLGPGEALLAPGVLKNPVLVEELYDRSAADRATLRNLLQREGYESLAQVREEGRDAGREEGREEGRALSVLKVLTKRGIDVPSDVQAQILACRDLALLDGWLERAIDAKSLADVMG